MSSSDNKVPTRGIKIIIYTKKCVVKQILFVTYLYVYVYDNIKDYLRIIIISHQICILSAGLLNGIVKSGRAVLKS